MASTTSPLRPSGFAPTGGSTAAVEPADWRDPRYQAFALMRLAFTVAPIAFGLDKFFNVLVHWPDYLAPWINDIAPGTGQQFMYVVGVTETSPASPSRSSRATAPTSWRHGWAASSSTC